MHQCPNGCGTELKVLMRRGWKYAECATCNETVRGATIVGLLREIKRWRRSEELKRSSAQGAGVSLDTSLNDQGGAG